MCSIEEDNKNNNTYSFQSVITLAKITEDWGWVPLSEFGLGSVVFNVPSRGLGCFGAW